MFKKFFIATILLLMVAAQASAKEFMLYESCGSLSYWSPTGKMKIKGNTQLYGDLSKGVAVFDDNLYFHFDTVKKTPVYGEASRFGDEDISNTVQIYTFEGLTNIFPLDDEQGNEYYLLSTEYGGGGRIMLIGARQGDGKWVKYFEISSSDIRNIFGKDFYLTSGFYAEGDSIVVVCENLSTKEIHEIHYKWDTSRSLFQREII